MTAISIVVADIDDQLWASARAVLALERELSPGDEVVWVGPGRTRPYAGRFRLVTPPPGESRGALYGCGLRATDRPLVAFTDSLTELGVGWRDAAVGALSGNASVVGGPVRRGPERSLASRAGFLVEYGPHAVPPYTNEQGDVSANNVAYRRSVLDTLVGDGAPVWKSVLDKALTARGVAPLLVPGMCVTSLKRYHWLDLTRSRAHHGRLYGAQRSAGWSWSRRVAASAGCGVLPALAFARLGARTLTKPGLRGDFVVSAPIVIVALAAWSAGEAAGYVSGREGPHAVR